MKTITKYFLLSLICSILFISNLYGYSQNIRVSLLTQDAGEEIYAFFGHTAIRIKDDSLHMDRVYNYGTFDFNTPNFYTRFLKGDLDYCLSIDDYDYFIYFSEETNRTIHEQVLDLSYEEKIKMLVALQTCYNTDARYYRYDFLKNNCATKIRDIIEEATNGRIDFSKANYSGHSFRQLLEPYIAHNYWINFGMNLGQGLVTDQAATPSDYMFLPVYIHDYLEGSEFVSENSILVEASPEQKTGFNFSYLPPWIIALIVVLLSLWPKTRKFTLYTYAIIFGLTGLVLLFFGIYSEHASLGHNMNILWTIPALLILIIRNKKIKNVMIIIYLSIILLLFATWSIFPQELSNTFLPWMLSMSFVLFINSSILIKVKKLLKITN